ncbi:MAG: DeoR/GlpR family DNA-binding transcription regulator [Sciscionella sp.]
MPLERLGFENSLVTREGRFAQEKSRIAHSALPIALEADSIFLDEGTTTSVLAELLRPEKPLTVVTASLPIAVELAARPNITALCLGGRVRTRTTAVVDHWATNMMAELIVDIAFLGTNGISMGRGLSCPDTGVAAVKTQAIKSARRSVLLADHSKFGSDSFAVFAPVTDFTCVITDDATSKSDTDGLKRRGVNVVRA